METLTDKISIVYSIESDKSVESIKTYARIQADRDNLINTLSVIITNQISKVNTWTEIQFYYIDMKLAPKTLYQTSQLLSYKKDFDVNVFNELKAALENNLPAEIDLDLEMKSPERARVVIAKLDESEEEN